MSEPIADPAGASGGYARPAPTTPHRPAANEPTDREGIPDNAVITWVVDPAPARDGPLAGRTLLVKDLIDTAGVRTTYGSRVYADHVPERTAPAVRRLVAAGAVVVGKGNLVSSRGA